MSSRTGRTARTTPTERRHEGERLIELLEEQDPDAEVLVMMQQNWPFGVLSLAGVTTREEMLRADRDEDVDGDEDEEPRASSAAPPRTTSSSSRANSSATARRRRGAWPRVERVRGPQRGRFFTE